MKSPQKKGFCILLIHMPLGYFHFVGVGNTEVNAEIQKERPL
jgi:hypothetical protein